MRRFFVITILVACLGLLATGCCCEQQQPQIYQGKYKTIWSDGSVTYTDLQYEFVKYSSNDNGDSDFVGKAPIEDSKPDMFVESSSYNAHVIDISKINPERVTFLYPPSFEINSQNFEPRFEANNQDGQSGDYVTTDLIGPILGLAYTYDNEGKKFWAEYDDKEGEGKPDIGFAVTTYRTWYDRSNPDGFVLSHYKFADVTYTSVTTGDDVIEEPATPGTPDDGLSLIHCSEGNFPNGLNVYDYTFDKSSLVYKQDESNNNTSNGNYL
ncbi:MAG: hypothetical protein LBJ00_01320 [Planctomycetaceae bacterium]|jgi:hypothetical protein|nr:hypothetical protein [Planctomycetaceae bacterium]